MSEWATRSANRNLPRHPLISKKGVRWQRKEKKRKERKKESLFLFLLHFGFKYKTKIKKLKTKTERERERESAKEKRGNRISLPSSAIPNWQILGLGFSFLVFESLRFDWICCFGY